MKSQVMNQTGGTMNEYGTSADIADAHEAAVEQATEDAVRAILAVVHGEAARAAATRLAERFGFVVSEPQRPPCPVVRHAPDCSCCYVGEQGRWHVDPACQPDEFAGEYPETWSAEELRQAERDDNFDQYAAGMAAYGKVWA